MPPGRLRRAMVYVGVGAVSAMSPLVGIEPAVDPAVLPFGDSPIEVASPDQSKPISETTPPIATPLTTLPTTSNSPAAEFAPAPAVLTINAPDRTGERVVQLAGWANAGTRVFTVTGQVEVGSDGFWTAEVVLDPGPNTVVMEAIGPDGDIVRREIEIQSDADEQAIPPVAFSATQLYRASVEAEPYDFFSGTATPFSTVTISSPYGVATAPVDADGNWSRAVFFEAPGGPDPFPVTVDGVNGTAEFDFFYSPPNEIN